MDNGAMDRDQVERYAIALDRWRADLLLADADLLDQQGRGALAIIKRRNAAYHQAMSDNLERFREDGDRVAFHVRRREIRQEYTDVVRRGFGDAAYDFPEPTPQDLGVN